MIPRRRLLATTLLAAAADVDAIAGHRDRPATECPGNAFAPTLPDLRREVAALLRPGVPRP